MSTWQDVQGLRKAGKPDEALQMAEGLIAESPSDSQARTQAGWVCFDLVKQVVARISAAANANAKPSRADLDHLHDLLRTYFRLGPRVANSALSNILGQILKVGRHFDPFLLFVKWASLRPEDFEPNEYQDKLYPSLAFKLARETAAWVKSRPDAAEEQVEFAVALAKTAQSETKDVDKTWLEWSLATLLRRTGDRRGAAELIVRVLKRKRTEFWTWAEAARIYHEEQPTLAIACFCQALRLDAETKYLGKVHRELAELLAEAGDTAQASRETLIAAEIYDHEGWRHPPELEALIQSSWYDPALVSIEPKAFYSQHADEALTLCFDEVHQFPGTYLGMTEPREGQKAKPRFAVRWDDRAISILGRRNARLLKALDPGKPVTLLVGIEGIRRDVLEVLPRSDGTDWDCTETKEGVISSRNVSGENITVYCNRKNEFRVPIRAWTGSAIPEPGTGVCVWGATNPMNERFEVNTVEAAPLPKHADIGIFNGNLKRTSKGFGFVDDVFVPAPLLAKIPPDAQDIAVVAVIAFDNAKERHSWRAVAISSCD